MLPDRHRSIFTRAGQLLRDENQGNQISVADLQWLDVIRTKAPNAFGVPGSPFAKSTQRREYAFAILNKIANRAGLSTDEEAWFCVAQHEMPDLVEGLLSSHASIVSEQPSTAAVAAASATAVSNLSLPTDPGRILEMPDGGAHAIRVLQRDFRKQLHQQSQHRTDVSRLDSILLLCVSREDIDDGAAQFVDVFFGSPAASE